MSIPFIDLKSQQARIREKIDAGISAVLNHGAYIMGPEINALELPAPLVEPRQEHDCGRDTGLGPELRGAVPAVVHEAARELAVLRLAGEGLGDRPSREDSIVR